MKTVLLITAIVLPLNLFGSNQSREALKIHDLQFNKGSHWNLVQDALDNGVTILRFAKDKAQVNFYAKKEAVNLKDFAASQSQNVKLASIESDGLTWEILRNSFQEEKNLTNYVTAFHSRFRGISYYGYSVGTDASNVESLVNEFLAQISVNVDRSLTGPEYKGQKYYLGFGAAMSFDPSMMQNEVKYDVLHTHDIFTKEIGGSYIGTKYTSYKDATSTNIKKSWGEIKSKIQSDDMYVQYSSGHGSTSGLAVGVTYNEIRDNALSYNAKETVIFIMACHSGALVDAFNSKKSEWQDYQSQGKTLFVMASSKASENSSTGPGTDPGEPGGPSGSAGSAFGYALWQSLIGKADGTDSGVKDGYLSLNEIQKYTVKRTKEVGGHSPVYTGAYDGGTIMNRVPSEEAIKSLGLSTEGLSDEEIMARIQALDAQMRM